jgi:TRAP-type uncharacterized transport system substrate-binding protein
MPLRWICVRLLLAILFATAFLTHPARAQKLPRLVTIGTNTPGTPFYSLAGGLVKVVSGNSPIQATVQPHSGNTNQLLPLHPAFREWTHERAASANVTIPFHPAAVKFYKETGVWKPAQKKLLAIHQ